MPRDGLISAMIIAMLQLGHSVVSIMACHIVVNTKLQVAVETGSC